MRIEIRDENRIIESAHSYDTKLSFNLFINTRDKNVFYDSVWSGNDEMTFFYYEPLGPDFVKLVAENEHDAEILGRITFENHTKDQLWICFLSDEVYMESCRDAMEDNDSQMRLQIEQAANGMVSGTLREWPLLKKALQYYGVNMADCCHDLELKKVCQDMIKEGKVITD